MAKSKSETTFRAVCRQIHLPTLDTQLVIQPFGDVHRFSSACAVDKWKAFCRWAKKSHTPSTYYLSTGDLDDMASASERVHLTDPGVHDQTKKRLDGAAVVASNAILEEIDFAKGNMLGFVQGNHFWDIDEYHQTTTQYMAEQFKAPWLGGLAYIRLSITAGKRTGTTAVDIVVSHGRAGGKLAGTTINQVDDLRRLFPNADIYIMGHDHNKGGWPKTVLDVTSGRDGALNVKQKRYWLIRSGSFLRGYIDGESTYPVASLYQPNDLGVVRLTVDMHRSQVGGQDRITPDIHCWS